TTDHRPRKEGGIPGSLQSTQISDCVFAPSRLCVNLFLSSVVRRRATRVASVRRPLSSPLINMHHARLPSAADVVGQGQIDVAVDLPLARRAAHLLPDLNRLGRA